MVLCTFALIVKILNGIKSVYNYSTRWLKSDFKEPSGCRFLYGGMLFIRMIRVALARVIITMNLMGLPYFYLKYLTKLKYEYSFRNLLDESST